MKVALYTRNSDREGDQSCPTQEKSLREHAKARCWKIVGVYSDPNKSGHDVLRPDYVRMLTDARERHAFDAVFVVDISRFWRHNAEQTEVLEELQEAGIHVISADGVADTTRQGWQLILSIMGSMNEETRRQSQVKTRASNHKLASDGKSAGGCPFGYRPTEQGARKWLDVDSEQAKIVRRIFREYADGYSPKAIAKRLNADGIPGPGKGWARTERRTDGAWHGSTICGGPTRQLGVVNNEIYVGRRIYNRSTWVDIPRKERKAKQLKSRRRRIELPRSKWVVTEAPELRIVDDLLWKRVKDRQGQTHKRMDAARAKARKAGKEPRRARLGQPPKHLFSGLLVCSECGSSYAMADAHKYACATRTECGDSKCGNAQRVRRDVLETTLLEAVRKEIGKPGYAKEFAAALRAELVKQREQKAPSRAELRRRLAATERQLAEYVAVIGRGLSSPKLEEAFQKAEADRVELQAALAAPEAKGTVEQQVVGGLKEFQSMLAVLPQKLAHPQFVVEARGILKDWIGPITIRPTEQGPVAVWSFQGNRVVRLVAGACFAPKHAPPTVTTPLYGQRTRMVKDSGVRLNAATK